MKKALSLVLAVMMLLGLSLFAGAYEETEEPMYFQYTTENYSYRLRDTDTGYTAGYIDVDVYSKYDGSVSEIVNVTDNSYVTPDYRLNGSVTKISDTQVEISYICVPLFSAGSSIRVECTLTADANGNLRASW